ncbi:hypothetical protein HYDPIDRAFT_31786 [Hydnomerulius pinastri MD-312]|uniref:Piwi-domain-containing protein n=1 Tax=Hydnomerulius pinastri MD-312 TaxID=994086 RepID=A0A0C9W3R2_9AGAM|nr:hypothetical protein HYDPIDRAFT_31786 [Hydnomerulius pinastri MD-312]
MQDQPAVLDVRIADDSDKAIVAQFDPSGVGADGMPLRPDFGTKGKEITLRANYFPVRIQGTIYQYKVAVTCTTAPPAEQTKVTRTVKRRVFQLAEQTEDWKQAGMSNCVAHDSAEKLIAARELPQPLTIHVRFYEEHESAPPSEGGREYTLAISFVSEVDQSILDSSLQGNSVPSRDLSVILSALNLVLAEHPSKAAVQIGRNDDDKKNPDQRFFFNSTEPVPLDGALEARKGFYTSVRPAHQQVMVNVNACTAPFYKPQPFVDAMHQYRDFMSGGGMGRFGAGVKVKTTHTHRIETVRGLAKVNAREYKFQAGEFGEVTVEEFFQRKHGITLERPELPLVDVSSPRQKNYLPPEVCDIISGQGFRGELSGGHTTNLLDVACQPPNVFGNAIMSRGLDDLGFRNPGPVMEAFGVTVDPNMVVIPGRILDKPKVAYSGGATAPIGDRASWNLQGVKFAEGALLPNWAVLVIKDGKPKEFTGAEDPKMRSVVEAFRGMCIKSGMRVPKSPVYDAVQLPPKDRTDPFRDAAIKKIEQQLRSLMSRKPPPALVLVILADEDKHIYTGIKSLCDLKLDIATICMQSEKVNKEGNLAQYYANVALKVNMKMGGINHKLDPRSGAWLQSASTMVVGMDVTHPSRGSGSVKGTPSIVAVVASVDNHYAQYPASLAIRKSKVEIDRDDDVLSDMFVSRLQLYKSRNKGNLPDRVILYRDGVSESQHAQVRQYELPQMLKAFTKFNKPDAPYNPKLTIVVCGKRHHTRFYPTEQENAADDGNPRPGTVVDRGVTPVYEFDFFLQAHAGLKGTTRPTHYFVVHDENAFKADELQGLTNALSYMFARATKAVSLVSPAYWADIACERGRCYLRKLLAGHLGGASTSGGGGGGRPSEDEVFELARRAWGEGVSGPKLKNTMYYL